MKKFFALFLALMMLTSCALAAAPTVEQVELPKEIMEGNPESIFNIKYQGDTYSWRVEKITADGTIPVYSSNSHITVVLNESNLNADSSVIWDYWYDGDYTAYDGGNLHRLTIEGQTFTTMVFDFYVNYLTSYSGDYLSTESIMEGEVEEDAWYANNTACTFGPEFKAVRSELTDKWYTFSAIDLSVQGTQTFDLVAAGAWKIGTVTVEVTGDEVLVTYLLTEDIITSDVYDESSVAREFFTIFADIDSVTTVDPAEIKSSFAFGVPFSISADLGGDTNVLLYVNNIVAYNDGNPYVTRFWPNLPENKLIREAMLTLMNAN